MVSRRCGLVHSPQQELLLLAIILGECSALVCATISSLFVSLVRFATYNTLEERLPQPHTLLQKLARQAFIGFVASVVSDTVSNSLRVIKTYRQVDEERVDYCKSRLARFFVNRTHAVFLVEAARRVVAQDGYIGLFGRGLKTRILANGLQGLMFSVLWKLFLDL